MLFSLWSPPGKEGRPADTWTWPGKTHFGLLTRPASNTLVFLSWQIVAGVCDNCYSSNRKVSTCCLDLLLLWNLGFVVGTETPGEAERGSPGCERSFGWYTMLSAPTVLMALPLCVGSGIHQVNSSKLDEFWCHPGSCMNLLNLSLRKKIDNMQSGITFHLYAMEVDFTSDTMSGGISRRLGVGWGWGRWKPFHFLIHTADVMEFCSARNIYSNFIKSLKCF